MASWTTIINSIDWNSLFSGFIGSLVGAIVVLLTTHWQVKNTFRLQVDWERKRIARQENERYQSLVRNLIGELRDNLQIAPQAHDYYSWAELSSDTWAVSRGDITFLPAEMQDGLRQAYLHVQRYNSKLEDRRAADDFGKGYWDNTIQEELKQFSDKADEVIRPLGEWLQEHSGINPMKSSRLR